ncbi:hypothetical protein HPB47_004485, partial [Ixodes persulcatus]
GYHFEKARGRKLAELISTLRLTLLTDPTSPTRIGNSVTRDTCPDLSLVKNIKEAARENLGDSLGSDHCLLRITLLAKAARKKWGHAKLTDWPKFRTQEIPPTTEAMPAVDNHLLCLWEARRSLTKRWKKQKLNRKFKARIKELTEEAAAYAAQLTDSNWIEKCNLAARQMSSRGTWRLFRSLIDLTQTRGQAQRQLRRALHGGLAHTSSEHVERKLALQNPGILGSIPTLPVSIWMSIVPADVLRLVHAFVTSRILYSVPYLRTTKQNDERIDAIIRKATKRALDLPVVTSNAKLSALGVLNSYQELKEAHLVNQYTRRSQTVAGRRLLDRLHIQHECIPEETCRLPELWRHKLWVSPVPRNMDTQTHEGRREARARALEHQYESKQGVYCVDVPGPSPTVFYTAAVVQQDQRVNGLSYRVINSAQAEEVAIALAASAPNSKVIITDSRRAFEHYLVGEVSLLAHRILKRAEMDSDPHLNGSFGLRATRASSRPASPLQSEAAHSELIEPDFVIKRCAQKHRRPPWRHLTVISLRSDLVSLNDRRSLALSLDQTLRKFIVAVVTSGGSFRFP